MKFMKTYLDNLLKYNRRKRKLKTKKQAAKNIQSPLWTVRFVFDSPVPRYLNARLIFMELENQVTINCADLGTFWKQESYS